MSQTAKFCNALSKQHRPTRAARKSATPKWLRDVRSSGPVTIIKGAL